MSSDPEKTTQEQVDNTDSDKPDQEESNKADPVRGVTRILIAVVVVLFLWYVAADRLAPWTDQARVQAYVVPIVPQVSGIVTKINVDQDDEVKAGDVLLQIDPTDYELAVQIAETSLELAGQEIGAGTASVASSQSRLVEAQANLSHILVQSERIFAVEKKGVVAKSEGDKARAAVKQARAQVGSAESELEKAKQQLGDEGEDNPTIRSATTNLKKAQLDLARTKIIAPATGGITNLKIETGHYAAAGTPLMTFIAVDDVWIQANLRENNIANIKVGDKVDISLDVAPGRIFRGSVISMGFAVGHETGGAVGELDTIQGKSGWLRDAQRFPVNIIFDDDSASGLRRLGGQADVQFYGDNGILNALGWLWIRLLSWLSYVY